MEHTPAEDLDAVSVEDTQPTAPLPVWEQMGITQAEYTALLGERDRRKLEDLKDNLRFRNYRVSDDGHNRFQVSRARFNQVAHGYEELAAIAFQRCGIRA